MYIIKSLYVFQPQIILFLVFIYITNVKITKIKSFLLIKTAKIDQFKKTKVIQKALFIAFKMVISDLKSFLCLKIYSRKTVEKMVKKVVFCQFQR